MPVPPWCPVPKLCQGRCAAVSEREDHHEALSISSEAELSNSLPGDDLDECLLYGGELCQHLCINTVGSYKCSCFPEFTLQEDGTSCSPGENRNLHSETKKKPQASLYLLCHFSDFFNGCCCTFLCHVYFSFGTPNRAFLMFCNVYFCWFIYYLQPFCKLQRIYRAVRSDSRGNLLS